MRIPEMMTILNGGKAAAVVPWYLAGGIDLAHCLGAYTPLGAANLAASLINIVNPGTYNLTVVGTNPAFSPVTGWRGIGAAYITTGISFAANAARTIIVRIAGAGDGYNGPFGLVNGTTVYTTWYPSTDGADTRFLNPSNVIAGGKTLAGIGAVSGAVGYIDAVSRATNLAITNGGELVLLASASSKLWVGYLLAAVIYDINLTQPQVAAVGARMLSLP